MRSKILSISCVCLLAFAGIFGLSGCKHLSDIYTPSSYTLDDLHIDINEARTEVINGYKGYAGKVIKLSPINGAKWSDYSRAIYWEWNLNGTGYYQINVSMSVLVESPNGTTPIISAYKPSQKTGYIPSSIKWNGPGNIGWTVQFGDDQSGQFGGGAVTAQAGKWVDLNFTQAIDITNSSYGQIYLDGHNDNQGLVDLTIYIRNIKITMEPTSKFVALTFNGGPTDFTDFLLDKLDSLQVKGTFFLLGMGIDGLHPINDKNLTSSERAAKSEERKAQVKRIFDDGNELANFSYTHSSVISYPLSEASIRKELEDTQVAIQKAVYGESDFSKFPWVSRFCRIPYDTDPAKVINLNKVAAALGLPIIKGTESSADPSKSADEIADLIYEKVTPWGVIVSQDPRFDPSILKVLDILVPRLQAEGYVFLTLSDMVEMRGKDLTPGNVYDNLNPSIP